MGYNDTSSICCCQTRISCWQHLNRDHLADTGRGFWQRNLPATVSETTLAAFEAISVAWSRYVLPVSWASPVEGKESETFLLVSDAKSEAWLVKDLAVSWVSSTPERVVSESFWVVDLESPG